MPPRPEAHLPRASSIHRAIATWTASVGGSDVQTRKIFSLLDRRQLLWRFVRKGIKKFDTPRGLRFLFRYHCARILGWRERLPEGHPQGFTDKLNHALRFSMWTDVGVNPYVCRLCS